MRETIVKHPMKSFAVLLLGLLPAYVCAQDYPSKPIRVIVAFPPGSSMDVIARVVGPKVSESLGQPVIVESRGGAGGNIGAQVVSKTPADGYTLLATSSAISINVTLYKNPGFAIGDFIPLIRAGSSPNLIFANPSVPAKNLQELFTLAKGRQLSYASAGTGTGTQLFMEMLKKETRTDITHVPFSPAAAVTAVLGNQAPMGITSMPMALTHVRSGKLTALAVTTPRRVPSLPEVPTVGESGFPGFEDTTWFAFFVRSGTPAAIVSRLNAELSRAMELADVREKFASLNIEFTRNSPAEFAESVNKEIAKYAKAIRETGAVAE